MEEVATIGRKGMVGTTIVQEEIAGTLQRADLITSHRLAIVDREGLEEASCECYRAATALLTGVTSQTIALR
jgi:hypothetical protein